jgi:hypothetical protein
VFAPGLSLTDFTCVNISIKIESAFLLGLLGKPAFVPKKKSSFIHKQTFLFNEALSGGPRLELM